LPEPPGQEESESRADASQPEVDAPETGKSPAKIRRLIRITALSLTAYATLAANFGVALGMDFAIFGQEFHNQARTFSLLQASLGTLAAATMVWPLGLALDGNGDFWATTLTALVAGGAAIGVMYAWSHGDPDRLLAQSFTAGPFAFISAIVAYELTSDTSARHRRDTGEGDAWLVLAPVANGLGIGIAGQF
jgi:hypothetical protein